MMYFPTQWGAKEASKSQGSCVPEGAYRTAQVVLAGVLKGAKELGVSKIPL